METIVRQSALAALLSGMKQKKARTTHGHRPAGGPLAFGSRC